MAKEIRIVRKDRMLAGYNGNLESVLILKDGETNLGEYDKATDSYENGLDVFNGVLVKVGGLIGLGRETKVAHLATEDDIGEDVLFIHNSEVMYDERLHKLEDFYIKNGKVARAYRLYDGDIVTLTADCFAESVDVGDKLAVKVDGKLGKVANVDNAKVVFEVIEDSGHELHYSKNAFAVQIKRN